MTCICGHQKYDHNRRTKADDPSPKFGDGECEKCSCPRFAVVPGPPLKAEAYAPISTRLSIKAPMHRLGEVGRALEAVARQIEYGSAKEGRTAGDWRQLPATALLDKLLRHACARARGELLDEDGRSHAVAAATVALMLIEMEGK